MRNSVLPVTALGYTYVYLSRSHYFPPPISRSESESSLPVGIRNPPLRWLQIGLSLPGVSDSPNLHVVDCVCLSVCDVMFTQIFFLLPRHGKDQPSQLSDVRPVPVI